jgi:hypothetical protein
MDPKMANYSIDAEKVGQLAYDCWNMSVLWLINSSGVYCIHDCWIMLYKFHRSIYMIAGTCNFSG